MEDKNYIEKAQWVCLPGDTRFKLRKAFGINLTEPTEVVNDTVVSDGVSADSLRNAFSVSKMRAYLGVKAGECDELFRAIVDRVTGVAPAPIPEPEPTEPEPEQPVKVEAPKKKRASRKNG